MSGNNDPEGMRGLQGGESVLPEGDGTGIVAPPAFRNAILRGDALEILPGIPGGSVDLTVFSPPYDGIRDYGRDWSLDYKTLGSLLFDVTCDGGVCVVVIGDGTRNFAKSLTTFRWAVDWVDRIGWRMFECCIYSRHGNPGAWWTQRLRVDHGYCGSCN